MTVDPRVDIGHVHLKVADLDRALAFWRDVLGFEEQAHMGDQAAFISAGGYHHHIGLNTWSRRAARPLLLGRLGSITSPYGFRIARRLRKQCTAFFERTFSSKARPITARARRSIYETPMDKSRR